MTTKQTHSWQMQDGNDVLSIELTNFDEAWELLHFAAKLVRSTNVYPEFYTQNNLVEISLRGTDNSSQAARFKDGILDYLNPKKVTKVVTNTTNITTANLYTDGGSRGNPGVSASGFVLYDAQENEIERGGEYLGITTNNQAEYHSLKLGLETALSHNVATITIHMDSQLVVNQIKGVYKVKNRDLYPLFENCKKLLAKFESFSIVHVPRELNKVADGMVNRILDEETKTKT